MRRRLVNDHHGVLVDESGKSHYYGRPRGSRIWRGKWAARMVCLIVKNLGFAILVGVVTVDSKILH